MSRLSMKDGRIVLDDQSEKPKSTTQKTSANDSRLSMVDGRIVLADRAPVNTAKNQSYLQRTQKAQQEYLAMDDYTPQRRSSNVMEMAINSLRNRLANSTAGNATREWASRMSNTYQTIANETPVERARRQQARIDRAALIDQIPDNVSEARRQQWAIDNAQLIDQASSMYEGPTRTERVRGRNYDTSGADMFSNDWEPGAMQEYDYLRTVRNERYNPLSREDRDDLINRYADAVNGNVDANTYQQILYDVTKNGGIEQLYREQQSDAANDREYGRQLRGVDLDSMNIWRRIGGTLGGVAAASGEQIASSGLGLVASGLNREASIATQEYGPALEQTARRWFYGLVNGADDPSVEEQIRTVASYAGVDGDALINRIRDRAEQAKNSDEDVAVFAYGLLDGLEADQDKIWENAQQAISEAGFYDAINKLQQKSAENIQYAKDVNPLQNSFGDNLVEAGVSTIQNAADAAMAAALGLSGTGVVAMIPFALRAYGGSYAEQMQQATELGGMIGQDVAKRAATSAGMSSAIEVGTEMMWGMVGAMSKVTGGGALDDYAQERLTEVLSGWAKTEKGRKVLTFIGEKALGGVTEGLEEVIGDAAEQMLKNAGIMPGEADEFSEWVKNAGHSFVTGALGGLLGETTSIVMSPMQKANIGQQVRNGTLDVNLNDLVDMANAEGMENSALAKTYSELFKGMPRSVDSLSNYEVGKLYDAYGETITRSDEAIERLREMVAKVESGEELKRSDVNKITNNPEVVQQLQEAAGGELNLGGNINERRAAVEMALRAFASQNETLRNAMTENLSPNAENANTGDLASRIENLPMINRQAMPAEIARSYFDASVGQTVNDAAERMGIGEEGRKIMSGLYSGNRENAIDYVGEMTKPYNLGRENKDLNLEDIPANGTVSAEEYQAAWRAGRLDYLAETARKEINNDRAGQEVLVREGAERMDGQNPVGSSSAVGEIAGSPQVGQTGLQQRSAGTERVYSGTQVGARITESQLNARDMAAAGYNVVTDNNDAEANAVKNEVALKAKKYGINVRDVVLFRGAMANVNGFAERGFFIYHPDGTITIAAQLDNADATGRQIITHEFTHALIKNLSVKLGQDALGNLSESGESSFGTVRDYMAQELGGQDKLVEAVNGYAAVYKAAGVIAADANGNVSKADMQMVFEEMICDFVAGMNAFSEVGHISQAVRSTPVMAAAKKAVEKLANETRGSPSAEAYLPRTQSEQRSRYDGSSEMYAIDPNGRKYSLGSLKSDIFDNKFQNDLISKLGWTQNQVKALVASLNDLMEYIKPNRDILDLNETYTKENRPYSPYKPNSDPLYKISLDYSTLCRKRLMTQYIIEKLQLREHRPMSGEEQIAIRDMLKEYRQIESGLQVACAMCYVEAARLKSPDQMNRYFEDPTPVLKNFFAQKNKAYKRKVENLQKKWKTDHGYDANATKKEMTPADVSAFNEYSSKIRHDYDPATDQADAKRRKEELDAIERAKTLSPDNYLSAANLADLKEKDQLIYDAYTSNIRAATRSKGLETDVPYYYGDSRKKGGPSDKFIKNVNAENGMRFSSWSDFQFTHLLDQMMAVIDLSVRKAAMHGYTKFPEQVRIFGKTGAMFNMSGVPDATGLNSDGSLRFSPTESIDIEEARRLRDQFPETAGVQCIGISDEHVKALLRSDFIDYVIPYHVSGLNAVLRQMVKIASWQDYTGSQEESVIDSKAKWEDSDRKCPKDKWHKGPVFSEFFDPAWYTDPAYKGKGVDAMREAAKRYVQMCADRGMRPKFTQFLGEENYWKLLIDRKMVNQKTGDLIQQKPVTPDFDFDVIKKEIADYVEKTRAEQGIEDRAFDYVSEHWDEMPGRIAALKQEGAVEKNIAKAEERKRRVMEHQANVLGNEMYAAAPKNVAAYKYSRDLNADYMKAAESGDTETAAKLVKQAAEAAGYTVEGYHGTLQFGFTKIDRKKSDYNGPFFVTADINTARTYSTKDEVTNINRSVSVDEMEAEVEEKNKIAYNEAISFGAVLSEMAGIQGWADIGYIQESLNDIVEKYAQSGNEESFKEEMWTLFDNETWALFDAIHGHSSNGDDMYYRDDVDDYDEWIESDETKRLRKALDEINDAYVDWFDALRRYYDDSYAGNYHVYINPSNLFVLDCKGRQWNSLEGDGKILKETNYGRYWNTRSVGEWAEEHGYDGVLFHDVVDDGGRGTVRVKKPADVYALFNPRAQVKSADPITYDEDGNIIPLEERFNPQNDDIRFSRDLSSANNFDSLYTTLEDGRIKPNNVEDLSTEDWKLIYKAVNKLGYGLESAKQAKEVYSRYVGQGGFNKEQSEAIKKAYGVTADGGVVANPKREALARKTFGTTGDFREAGYLMRNGSMLDFSGKKDGGPAHVRYMDHREIGSVFGENEIPEDKRRYGDNSAYMNAFISEGNIRLMDGQGVTIGEMEPTAQQYTMLRQFIDRVMRNEDYFYLDLSNNDGYTVASRDYEGRDGSAKVIRDIKEYFKNGELPYRSNLSAFFSRDLSNGELYEANRQLQKDLTELRSKLKTRTEQRDYWRGQTKVTEGRKLRIDDVTKLAREIIKGQESSADAKTVAEKMKALGEYILNTTDENVYDEARLKAYEIAHEILSNAKVLNEQGGEHFYKDFRAALKQTPIYVTPSVREEVSPDGWNGLRQMAKGIFTPTADKSKGKTVDVIYHDLQSTFGEWLLPEYVTSEADQLNKIFEVVETYQPVYENINSYDMADATEWTANEILTRIIGEEIRETNPTYADRMEKKLSDQKAKSQEALRRVREQRDRKVQNLKEHYQQVAEDRRNRKIDSEMRTRLLNIAKRLNNKKLDRVQRALLDKYIGDLDLVSKSLTGRTIHDLEYLKTFYEAYKERMGEDFIPDKFIEKKIDRLNKKHISDMTQEEVADLTTVLLNLETLIRTENKLIDSQIKADIYAAGSQTIDDVNNSNGKDTFLSKAIGAETATPERYLHRITGYRENSPLYQAAKELSDGQRKMLDYQMRAESLFLKWTRDKKFTRRIAGKHAEEITISGRVNGEMTDVKITPAMRMALYLHEQNDDNMRHISQGGVKIPNMELYKKGKLQEAYDKGVRVVLTRGQVREIVSHMSAEERAFANAVNAYYNGMSRNEINDTSEKLRGYAIAGVEKYYPIDSDGAFLRKEFDQLKRDGTLEGMGILKERIEGASNAIMLYDMNDTLNRSISQHSKYVGLAIPVRNFNRLYGVTTFKDKAPNYNQNAFDSTWEYDTSVIETIQKNWGSTATNYISKMMTDLQNGTGLKDDFWGGLLAKARSHYAGAVLNTNASVAMKQAASYPTAAAVVGYGPLMRALADVKKIDLDKLAQYTPLLWYRSKGFSTTELGDIGKEGGHIPKALNWIQAMDVATTTKLAKAAMYYVNENNNLTRGTDAWWKAVAEVYNRIIEETQPNYTMMQRPQILRSDNALTRALNMFKTQPFQNFNILYDAFGNLAAKSREYKANATQENLQALKSARTNVARAVSSQVVSAFVFSLMQFAWDAFRGKAKKYKDDDEEMTFASWLKGMGINVLSSVGGMVPFGSYALELGEAMTDAILKGFKLDPFFDQTFYGLSENAAESMNDMGNALISLVTKTTKALQGEATTETTVRGLIDGAADIAQFAGLPVSNVIKLAQSIARNYFLTTDGKYIGGFEALRVTTDPSKYKSDYYNLLRKAWENDQDAFNEIRKRMIDLPGDPFATSSKTAEENIDAKVKEWRKETASQDSFYGTIYDGLTGSALWDEADPDQQNKALSQLLSLALEMGVEGSDKAGAKSKAAIDGGASVGLDATEYMLYQLALSMTNSDGGTAKNSEYEEAIRMVPGLSNAERSYLWSTTHSSDKNNPWK